MADKVDNTIIKLSNIGKGFKAGERSFDVLTSIDFQIKKRETIAIVGASGIGKSTLLHIIGTLEKPDTGELWFNGNDVLKYSSAQLAKFRNEKIGFVFQFHHLLPEFTAMENVMMPMLIGGRDKVFAEDAAEMILKRVGLEHRLLNKAATLSGGEQQRVAIARAIVQKPVVLLADEPTGNLDRKNSEQVHELMDELNKEFGMTTIVVTHNVALAQFMDKRVSLLEGKLISDPSADL